MIQILPTYKGDFFVQKAMKNHYTRPRGFVGRQLFYEVRFDGATYGVIAFGSAVRFLPGRKVVGSLNNGLNNILYHIEKVNGKYPLRNFTSKVLLVAEQTAAKAYEARYGDKVTWFESLVELPREGILYLKADYLHVGTTIGYTCKRDGDFGTDAYSGARRWDTENLRPKKVFYKVVK